MPAQLTVLYPRVENYRFDEKYYKDVHMPLVEEKWGKHGLKEWHISKLESPDPSKPSEYGIQAVLIFPSAEAVRTAFEKDGKEVFGDIKNFTNVSDLLVE
ncbi:hypothetical protein P389DRAFT_166673 [Cystobasidium minutum MCA 4210]|uniref:uncharacterized protein n=1 Tax=Cystobasidium minutum MCA 4210 TaxID=1397322 RepID=UPI0034CECCE2|eukprot:jgi/Rhomi1/166673/fgenesh1_kg.2_\